MRVLTINELMRLARIELTDLLIRITKRPAGPSGRLRRTANRAQQPAQHQHVLARHDLTP
jgi:hypothetical protein